MKHVFGPIPSRRLGQSLGVDPVPFKTCNWNCVYCQLGRTAPLFVDRREFFPSDDIIAEVEEAVRSNPPGSIDWITFAGSGEPTQHLGLGRMIRGIRERTGIPVAVITNGALLYLEEVRNDLLPAEAVLPTLDAGSERAYRLINRAAPSLSFESHVEGLVEFRRQYRGSLRVEVMLVAGINDSEQELAALAAVLDRVEPDEVHVSLPVRPPAESWVRPLSEERLTEVRDLLGARARLVPSATGVFGASGLEDVADAVVAVVMRHPMNEDELIRTLARWSAGEVESAIQRLAEDGRLLAVERNGRRFWCFGEGKYREGGAPHGL